MGPTDQETTATEKTVYSAQFPREGVTPRNGQGHMGKIQVTQKAEGNGRNVDESLLCGSHGKELPGRYAGLRLNNSRRIWGRRVISNCLVPDPGIVAWSVRTRQRR